MSGTQEKSIPIHCRMDGNGKPFGHFYAAAGYVNVDYTLTEPTLRMLTHLSSYHNHLRYMRMHNTLTAHGRGDAFLIEGGKDFGNEGGLEPLEADGVVRLCPGGQLSFDWSVLDRAYDALLAHGIRPIVETDYLPSCLRRSRELWFVPRDYRLWSEVIRCFVLHLQERYGAGEIERWYFEVWNEPDIHGYWLEHPESFLALYDHLEVAAHGVNPALKVGGPAVTQNEAGHRLFRVFLEHCARGVNYATDRHGTRVDFLSVHCKAGSARDYCPATERIFDSLRLFLEEKKAYPQLHETEFLNDESGIVWGGNLGVRHESWLNFRNTHYFPGFFCKMVDTYCRVVEDEIGTPLTIIGVDDCQLQWERALFSGNRSLLTPLFTYPSTDLLRKPAFNAYVLLSRLGEVRLGAECAEEGFGRKFGALPTRSGNGLSVMVWNFEDGMEEAVNGRRLLLELTRIPFRGRYRLLHYRIDAQTSSAYAVWRQLGQPARPSVEQVRRLRLREGLELLEPLREMTLGEHFNLELEMPMHSVSLIQLVPENPGRPAATARLEALAERGANGNHQVFLSWSPSLDEDFLFYRLWRRTGPGGECRLLREEDSFNTGVHVDMEVEPGRSYAYRVQAVNASLQAGELSAEVEVMLPASW